VNGDDDGVSQVVLMNDIYMHVAYDDFTLSHDAAVLVLAEAVTVTTDYALWHGGPGADSLPNLPTSQDTLTVSGWGTLVYEGPSPDKLQKVDVFAWTNAQCGEGGSYAYSDSDIDSSMLCAGDPYPGCTGSTCVDSCQGDSGGPLVTTVGGSTVLVGIVSWGFGCASGYPGVYARVLALADFVGDYTNPAYGVRLCTQGVNTCGTSSYIFAEDSYGDG
jgi:secreted trypsin-like serine protease